MPRSSSAPPHRQQGEGAWVLAVLAGPLLGWAVSAPMVLWTESSLTPRLLTGVALGAAWPLLAMIRHAVALRRSGAPWRGVALVTLLVAAAQGASARRLLVGPAAMSGVVADARCEQAAATPRHPSGGCLRCAVRLEAGAAWRAACSVGADLRAGDRITATVLDDVMIGSTRSAP